MRLFFLSYRLTTLWTSVCRTMRSTAVALVFANTLFCHFCNACPKVFSSTSKHLINKLDVSAESSLFDSDEVLHIRLSGSIRELLIDRGDKVQKHRLVLSYIANDSSQMSIPVEVKTRGHFRKTSGTCLYPPLMLQFTKDVAANASVFAGQKKLKLVMPCQGDEYVVREWLIYRLYNLLTTKSFKARLVRVELDDTKKKKVTSPFFGVLLEDEQHLAKRNHSVLLNKKMVRPEQAEVNNFLTMAVFQYLIGNTDWSVQYLQNVKLLLPDSAAVPITVPYDFDHAGLVNAPYAKPAEELRMYSVVERRYRGYCLSDIKGFTEIIALFNKKKKDLYNLYTTCPFLDAKYVKTTLKYFDDFYATINNNKVMKKEFSYPCDPAGTGNVVIKGLARD